MKYRGYLSLLPRFVVVSFNVMIKGIRQDWSVYLGSDGEVCAAILICMSLRLMTPVLHGNAWLKAMFSNNKSLVLSQLYAANP